jgi:fatty acid amide hydrolase
VLLCPGYGIPATLHGFSKETTPAASYTFLWNTVNFPAGTVPVTTVRPDEEE